MHTLNQLVRGRLFNLLQMFVGLIMLASPLAAQAANGVNVAQSPLTVRQPVPPNIMLMLDDSGSMDRDYMPDNNYISDTSEDGMRDYEINGTYYNPGVLYSPPPKADGSSYPNSPGLGNAYENGFTNTSDTRDVTKYDRDYPYYTKIRSQIQAGSYDPVAGCKSGDYLKNHGKHKGQCYHRGGWEDSYYSPSWNWYDGYSCNGRDKVKWHDGGYMCRHREYTHSSYYPPSTDNSYCPQGSYDSGTQKCVVTEQKTAYLFTYTTKKAGGGYTQHYVGKNEQACVIANAEYPDADCDYSAETRQSVANWFSYYRTRMLMAKSSLMNAFSGMSANYRFGYGSLHNNGGFPDDVTTTWENGFKLAEVEPFGKGGSATQKAKFWQWIVDAKPNNGTPLREALQAIGQYYQTAQPWQSTDASGDTHNLSCRQSYTILTTDGFWNGGSPGVGNADGNNGGKITGANAKHYRYEAEAPFKDGESNTLADTAMYYWRHDLRSSLDNEVPTSAADPAFWQHMVSFTIGLGFSPKDASGHIIDPDRVQSLLDWSKKPGSGNEPSSLNWGGWPSPKSNSVNNIADLVHAGVNGHGGFYQASSPQAFASGLKNALNRAAEREGTAASLAASSTHLKTGTKVYQALYHTAVWTGQLLAYAVDPSDGSIAANADWDAANGIPAPADRNIHTYNPDKGGYQKGDVAFKLSDLSAKELTSLGSDATAQANMVSYLRGNNSSDGKSADWRFRKTPLGDIVNSQPIYVGQVNANAFAGRKFAGSAKFIGWAGKQEKRSPRIYVAANDGMLHAFDVKTGAETYAFMPAAVIKAGIKKLANPDYGSTGLPHEFFNDGQLTVADAYFQSASETSATWHTVLVGTTGRGEARAVYALDVTDPDSISLLWERSAKDGKTGSGYIGQITGKPIIAQVADGQWAVLLGNGYNSAKGEAALLQFNLANGSLSVHTTNSSTGNGLATPGVWIGKEFNNVSTSAYAGDNLGNVWRFKLSDESGSAITPTPTSQGEKLYVAKDAAGNVQPITAGILLGKDPDTDDLWAFFGTGRDLAASDRAGSYLESWYGLIVKSVSGDTTAVSKDATRSDLAMRKIIYQEPGDGTSLGKRVVSLRETDDASKKAASIKGKSGWYIDLAYNGNRQNETMVTPNQFHGRQLLGTSRVPISNDPCNPGGRGWTMAVAPFTGTNPEKTFFDVDRDGKFDDSDKVTIDGKKYVVAGIGFNSIANNPISISDSLEISLHSGVTETINTKGGTGSLSLKSWRELTNP